MCCFLYRFRFSLYLMRAFSDESPFLPSSASQLWFNYEIKSRSESRGSPTIYFLSNDNTRNRNELSRPIFVERWAKKNGSVIGHSSSSSSSSYPLNDDILFRLNSFGEILIDGWRTTAELRKEWLRGVDRLSLDIRHTSRRRCDFISCLLSLNRRFHRDQRFQPMQTNLVDRKASEHVPSDHLTYADIAWHRTRPESPALSANLRWNRSEALMRDREEVFNWHLDVKRIERNFLVDHQTTRRRLVDLLATSCFGILTTRPEKHAPFSSANRSEAMAHGRQWTREREENRLTSLINWSLHIHSRVIA